MAKPFYSMEEVSERLGKSEDDIKGLVREGKLREFRDAGKIFFKAEDVDKLAGGGAESAPPPPPPADEDVALEPVDDELPSLMDAAGGSGEIGLEEPDEPEAPQEKKEGTVITSSGIGVFDEDELEIDADPMAETHITSGTSDEVSLEGSGGGSGLLDLTREADDTSLGAELLDEIYPGEEEQEAAPPPPAAMAEPEPEETAEDADLEQAEAAPVAEPQPVAAAVAAGDSSEGLFAGALVGTLLLLAVSGSVVAGVIQGYMPDYVQFFSNNFWFFLGGAALLVVLSLLFGWVIGRAGAPVRR